MNLRQFITLLLLFLFPFVSIGQDITLLGVAPYGGNHNGGVIYSITNKGEYNVLYHFKEAKDSTGLRPLGTLLQVSTEEIIGTASEGGNFGKGVMFSFNLKTNNYKTLYHFIREQGSTPTGALTETTEGLIFGVCRFGGLFDDGVIFSYDLKTNTYRKEKDLEDYVTGSQPYGGLLWYNCKLLGLTRFGGNHDNGVLFSYDPDVHRLRRLFNFKEKQGSEPYGMLIEGGNNKLYGSTDRGGVFGYGTLFEFNLDSGTHRILVHFDKDSLGAHPYCTLLETSNGVFYGTTKYGSKKNRGTIFKYSLKSDKYEKLIDFDIAETFKIGAHPQSSLIEASDGMIYGFAEFGGQYHKGSIFQLNPKKNTIKQLFNFNTVQGELPMFGSLIELNPCKIKRTYQSYQSCESFKLPGTKKTFTQAGTYFLVDTLKSNCGNDSIVEKKITIGSTTSFEEVYACDSFIWKNGKTYYESTRQPNITYKSSNGCDSILQLNLVIEKFNPSIIRIADTLKIEPIKNVNIKWFDCSTGKILAENTHYIIPSSSGNYAVQINSIKNINCSKQSDCFKFAQIEINEERAFDNSKPTFNNSSLNTEEGNSTKLNSMSNKIDQHNSLD